MFWSNLGNFTETTKIESLQASLSAQEEIDEVRVRKIAADSEK